MVVMAVDCMASSLDTELILLQGTWKYKIGDDSAWARPDCSDLDWHTISIPARLHLSTRPAIVWLRYKFYLPSDLPVSLQSPALSLGVVRHAAQVYLNGVKIGQNGRPGEGLCPTAKKEQIYKIAKDFFAPDRLNVLAVRLGVACSWGGITGPVLLGDYDFLKRQGEKRDNIKLIVESFVLGCFFIILCFCCFMYMNGMTDREYTYFGLSIFIYTLIFFLNSLMAHQVGLPENMARYLLICLYPALQIVLFLLICAVFQIKLNRWTMLFAGSFVFLNIVVLVFQKPVPAFLFLIYLSLPLLVWLGVLVLLLPELREKFLPEFLPFSAGIVLFWGAAMTGNFSSLSVTLTHYALEPYDVGAFFFILCTMYALNIRFARFLRETRAFSARLLKAQEDERKKISRELHDGLCQSLLGHKLQLQLLNSDQNDQKQDRDNLSLQPVISDVETIIQDARKMSLHLRPVFFEQTDLATAIKWYMQKLIAQDAGIRINYHLAGNIALDIIQAEHLYRIFQEAVTNVLRHADARTINITLKEVKDRVILKVEDNGRGFQTTLKARATGIGISIMRERAAIIGGLLRIVSKPGRGTQVILEVNK